MGDIIKKKVEKKSLAERVAEREKRQDLQNDETIAIISGEKKTEEEVLAPYQRRKTPPRGKTISARVNEDVYIRFKTICEEKGLSTNAGINMLIEQYVKSQE